jgi:serine/threonine-protein phosphatase 2B catalytic subunit
MTEYFSFKMEAMHKYDQIVYEMFLKSFCALPLAAIMNKQFFCVHGGISPELKTIDDIQKLDRFIEPPATGIMCDLLWSDPAKEYGSEAGSEHFLHNGARGCSYHYTYKGVCAFLDRNKLLCMIRAHEVQEQGYTIHKANKSTGFPSLITIFSAPNYLDAYKNKAAVLAYTDNINIKQFNASPHPYWLPDFMDVFAWSLPFVGTKLTDMLISILSICSSRELDDDSVEDAEADRELVRSKVKAIARMQNYFHTLRSSSETITKLKVKMGTEKLPPGYLHLGSLGIRESNMIFM